jgi:hypothetical protein
MVGMGIMGYCAFVISQERIEGIKSKALQGLVGLLSLCFLFFFSFLGQMKHFTSQKAKPRAPQSADVCSVFGSSSCCHVVFLYGHLCLPHPQLITEAYALCPPCFGHHVFTLSLLYMNVTMHNQQRHCYCLCLKGTLQFFLKFIIFKPTDQSYGCLKF